MAEQALSDLNVAIMAIDGFEPSEPVEPLKALTQAGANTRIVSPKSGALRGWQHEDWVDWPDDQVRVELALDDIDPDDFAALLPRRILQCLLCKLCNAGMV